MFFLRSGKPKKTNILVNGNRINLHLRFGDVNIKKGYYHLSNIKDVNGRIVNKKRIQEIFQYREMFVQEHNPKILTEGNCYMQNLPLQENCISKIVGKNKYWMNTPIKESQKVQGYVTLYPV